MTTVLLTIFAVSFFALLYGFILYPSFLVVVGAFVNKQLEDCEELPAVSLVIAAFNEENVLERKLANALDIEYPKSKLQILVGSDGSDDRTGEIAKRFESDGVQFFDYPLRRGKPSVLNDTIAKAEGEVLFLCDANVMFRPDALKRLVRHLSDPQIGAVTGDVRIQSEDANFGEGESAYYRLERLIQLGESKLGSVMGVDGGMYVIRKSLMKPLPAEALNEEFVASMRVIQNGFRIAYDPEAISTENATPSARQEWRRRVRVTAGVVQILRWACWPPLRRPVELWQFVSHKLLRWGNPIWLMGLFVSSLLLASTHLVFMIAAVGQVAFYLAALMGSLSITFRETKFGGIPFFFTMSHIAMVFGIAKGILGLQSATWKQADRPDTSPDSV